MQHGSMGDTIINIVKFHQVSCNFSMPAYLLKKYMKRDIKYHFPEDYNAFQEDLKIN